MIKGLNFLKLNKSLKLSKEIKTNLNEIENNKYKKENIKNKRSMNSK